MRLVLDTAVMVAAIRSDAGASRRLLEAVTGSLKPLVSVPLMIEYQAVVTRKEHLSASGLTASEADELLDAVASMAEPVRLAFLWRPNLRDPDDDMVLETGVNGRADAIVTFNRRDFAQVPAQFGIEVLLPGEALRKLGVRT